MIATKAIAWGIETPQAPIVRLAVAFLLFGITGLLVIESFRWADRKGTVLTQSATAVAPIGSEHKRNGEPPAMAGNRSPAVIAPTSIQKSKSPGRTTGNSRPCFAPIKFTQRNIQPPIGHNYAKLISLPAFERPTRVRVYSSGHLTNLIEPRDAIVMDGGSFGEVGEVTIKASARPLGLTFYATRSFDIICIDQLANADFERDEQNLANLIQVQRSNDDVRSHLNAIEPYVDFAMQITNSSVIDITPERFEGRLSYMGEPLGRDLELTSKRPIVRGNVSVVTMRQWISRDSAELIMKSLPAQFEIGTVGCWFSYQGIHGARKTVRTSLGNLPVIVR